MSNERQQAAKIKRGLAEQIEGLRRQKNLSREGRAAQIAKAVEDAKAKLAALRQAEAQRLAGRQDELERKLFGVKTTDHNRIMAIRQADKMASEITDPEKARAAMNKADRNNDHDLLRALAEQCFLRTGDIQHGQAWRNLFDQWAGSQYGGAEAVEELREIRFEQTNDTRNLERQGAFGVGTLPEEVRGVGNLRALAKQADEIPELPPTRAEEVGARLAAFARGDGGGY